PDLYCHSRLGDGNGAQASADCLAWSGRRFCWCWHLAWARSAFFFKRRTTSCDWNVNPSRFGIHLVGRIALFAQREACTFSVPHGSPANALRRGAAFSWLPCGWRTSEFSSAFNLGVVARVFHLSGNHWSCGWLHCLHLAASSL